MSKKSTLKPTTSQFTHLHVHSEYSMLDGMNKFKELMPRLHELGMKSIALTDHGVMYGTHSFHKEATAAGIKPIIGVEAYICDDHTVKTGGRQDAAGNKKQFHLTLLAKNKIGYHNLIKLVYIANTAGYYYKPRIDKKLLKQYSQGLIALSGCYGGELAQIFFKNAQNEELAIQKGAELVAEYQAILGEDYYLEIQRGTADQKSQDIVNPLYEKLAKHLKMPLVATMDAHYLRTEDAHIQDILWAVTEGKTIYDPKHHRMASQELYIKSPQEMAELFSDMPEAVAMTQEIDRKIETYEIKFDRIQPKFLDLPARISAKEHLRNETEKGLVERYSKITPALQKQIDYELKIIDEKGYNDYFLVVADYVNWAMKHDILVGPGRGSGPGSMVSYSLKITNLDPVKWGLSFERFLNPHRPSPPDFDIDFQDDRRHEVIQYMVDHYGRENVAGITAIGRMQTKAGVRDVCRALGVDLGTADRIAKLIPTKYGKPMPIKKAIAEIPELSELIIGNPDLEKMVQAVDRLNKSARHVSVHACGYVVTPTPITDYVPLGKAPQKENEYIIQYEMGAIEDLGLMKYDFLGLKNLTIIKNTLNAVESVHGQKILIDEIPEDDTYTFKMLQQALTKRVFQFESSGMRKYLRDLIPTSIDDLVFLAAAYRPGPMDLIPEYIDCKHGRKKPDYPHPDLEPILQNTYGYAIYQEQILEIAVKMAGYSVGEADILRRAMGKKKKEIIDQEKIRFKKGLVDNGYSQKLADKLFDYMEPFANYGFNKSHAASYALISYQTAYLKAHYPLEFMSGVMLTDLKDADALQNDIKMAITMGIEILPPHINKSENLFISESQNKKLAGQWVDLYIAGQLDEQKIGAVRFGLGGIKNVSGKSVEEIVQERLTNGSYHHLDDLLHRVDLNLVDKKTLLHFAMVGALDEWGDRQALIEGIPVVYEKYKKGQQTIALGQKSLFGLITNQQGEGLDKLVTLTSLPEVDSATTIQQAEWEQELLGVLLGDHPLGQIKGFLQKRKAQTIVEIIEQASNRLVWVGVQYNSHRAITTKNGDAMAFMDISDLTGQFDGVIFPTDYEILQASIQELTSGALIMVRGKYNRRNDKDSFIISDLEPIDFTSAQRFAATKKAEKPLIKNNNKFNVTAGGVQSTPPAQIIPQAQSQNQNLSQTPVSTLTKRPTVNPAPNSVSATTTASIVTKAIIVKLSSSTPKSLMVALKEKLLASDGHTTIFFIINQNGQTQKSKFRHGVTLTSEIKKLVDKINDHELH